MCYIRVRGQVRVRHSLTPARTQRPEVCGAISQDLITDLSTSRIGPAFDVLGHQGRGSLSMRQPWHTPCVIPRIFPCGYCQQWRTTEQCIELIDSKFRLHHERSRPKQRSKASRPAQSHPIPRHHHHLHPHHLLIPHPPLMAPLLAALFPHQLSFQSSYS
jgi:hypothetical protein